MFKAIVSTILFFLFIVATANDFSSKNLAHLYDPDAEIRCTFRSYSEAGKVTIFIHMAFKSELYQIEDYQVYYELKELYSDKLNTEIDTISLIEHKILTEENFGIFKFEFNNPEDRKFMFLSFNNRHNQKKFYFDVNIDSDQRFNNSGLFLASPLGIPFFRNYIKLGEPFSIIPASLIPTEKLYFVNYLQDFDVAQPPMALISKPVDKTMKIDSAFNALLSDRVHLKSKGLYLVQSDSTSVHGLGFRVTENHYPKFSTLPELVDALRYFSTRSEWNNLYASTDKKKAFDSYWIQVDKSQDKARRIIKKYFDNVMLASH